jgi:hypothetical protein
MGCLVAATLALPVAGQTIIISRISSSPVKKDSISVPVAITRNYELDNPLASHIHWFAYPSFDNDVAWYDYNPDLNTKAVTDNYSVEFVKGKTHQKAIYGRNGKKIATHGPLTSVLPAAISASIRNGIYKHWVLSNHKEQISQESNKDVVYYKLLIQKGGQKHTLFFLANGTLVKDKKTA